MVDSLQQNFELFSLNQGHENVHFCVCCRDKYMVWCEVKYRVVGQKFWVVTEIKSSHISVLSLSAMCLRHQQNLIRPISECDFRVHWCRYSSTLLLIVRV